MAGGTEQGCSGVPQRGPEQPSGSSTGREGAAWLQPLAPKVRSEEPSEVLLLSRSKTDVGTLSSSSSLASAHTRLGLPPGAPAQTPSAVSDPELVIFLKRLAAHTPMKFFCKGGIGEMLIVPQGLRLQRLSQRPHSRGWGGAGLGSRQLPRHPFSWAVWEGSAGQGEARG